MAVVSRQVQCCAKLHNVCVKRWLKNGRVHNFDASVEQEVIPEHVNIDSESRPTDAEVTNTLNNRYPGIGVRAVSCDLKVSMVNMIWDTGLRITDSQDLVGLPTVEVDTDV